MKHLFDAWEGIREKIQQARAFYLLLDYDGTLTPIVSRPEMALLPPEVKKKLIQLRDFPQVSIAVISGRSLEDICSKIGIRGITYVGNYGLEIQNPAGVHKKRLSLTGQRELARIHKALEEALKNIPEIFLENKESILAIHYRMVPKGDQGKVFQEMEEIQKKWGSKWQVTQGKMVFEIRPRADFHKGKAVRDLLRSMSNRDLLPFYFGDDQMDEDAFRFLRGKGITVFVGPLETPSAAEYFLDDPAEVAEFLERFIEARPGEDPPVPKILTGGKEKMIQ